MDLGAFSISLPVTDIRASRDFYAALGFSELGGDIEQNWLILRNGSTVLGLFQGMFDAPILTFNPGWDQQAQDVDPFTDVREIQRQLRAAGVAIEVTADESTSGPAHLALRDPDGHQVLIDQHR